MKRKTITSAAAVAVAMLTLCLPTGYAAEKAPNRPPLAKAPPEGWSFPTATLQPLPASAELLLAPAAATGDYDVAKTPPGIRFSVLPGQWPGASLWSAWGDALFASDTNFYCSIGDHAAPHGFAYVYQVNGKSGAVKMIADVNRLLELPAADYAPGKIHAPLMEFDGGLYFAGYRGGKGVDDAHHYIGDALIRWQLTDGAIERFAPPAPYCSIAASVIHAPLKMIYGVGPGGVRRDGKSVFFAYDIEARQTVYCGDPQPDATRAIIVAPDGRVYYSSGFEAERLARGNQLAQSGQPSRFARYDPKSRQAKLTDIIVPGRMLRAASRCNAEGVATCITWDGILFTFDTRTEQTRTLGKTSDAGPAYTAVCKLSPNGRYLYYMPGAHGGADGVGCPVIQFDTRTNRRKVLAFLFDSLKKRMNYFSGGSFGLDISVDGATLGICINGRQLDQTRSAQGSDSFDQVAVILLDIPESER